jgi:hypothetical protein
VATVGVMALATDIAAILDNEKLNPQRLRRIEAELNAEPQANASRGERIEFLAGKASAKYRGPCNGNWHETRAFR